MTARQNDEALILRINELYHELTHASFEAVHRRRFRIQRAFWRQVARHALAAGNAPAGEPVRPRLVVDLACGTGFAARALQAHLTPADHVVAFDLSHASLRAVGLRWNNRPGRQADLPGLSACAADVQALPLAKASADLVVMNAGLHHVPDPLRTLGQIDRVLKPGGFFALGFEPNRAHGADPVLAGLARGLARLHWYADPRQNWRRMRGWASRLAGAAAPTSSCYSESQVITTINDRLLREGLLGNPLPASRVMDLVDPHARGARDGGGFDPSDLLDKALPRYEVRLLVTSDYLGESARFWPTARALADAALRALIPGRGSLFSWLVRKPPGQSKEGVCP